MDDEYDAMVQRINTLGPDASSLDGSLDDELDAPLKSVQLENPAARGFVPCPTMQLFTQKCGAGIMGRQVNVNPKTRQELIVQYFSEPAVARLAAERAVCDDALEAARQERASLRSSKKSVRYARSSSQVHGDGRGYCRGAAGARGALQKAHRACAKKDGRRIDARCWCTGDGATAGPVLQMAKPGGRDKRDDPVLDRSARGCISVD